MNPPIFSVAHRRCRCSEQSLRSRKSKATTSSWPPLVVMKPLERLMRAQSETLHQPLGSLVLVQRSLSIAYVVYGDSCGRSWMRIGCGDLRRARVGMRIGMKALRGKPKDENTPVLSAASTCTSCPLVTRPTMSNCISAPLDDLPGEDGVALLNALNVPDMNRRRAWGRQPAALPWMPTRRAIPERPRAMLVFVCRVCSRSARATLSSV